MVNPENIISLVSVNTEGHRHIERLLPFLREIQPEVVLLQDCFERTTKMVANALGIEPSFVPFRRRELYFDHGEIEICGIATLSRYRFTHEDVFYYLQDDDPDIPMNQEFMHKPGEEIERLKKRSVFNRSAKGIRKISICEYIFHLDS